MWWNGDFHRVADPARHLLDGLLSLGNPVGSPVDKVRVGLYRIKVLLRSWEDVLSAPETSTMQRLKVRQGASDVLAGTGRMPVTDGKPGHQLVSEELVLCMAATSAQACQAPLQPVSCATGPACSQGTRHTTTHIDGFSEAIPGALHRWRMRVSHSQSLPPTK